MKSQEEEGEAGSKTFRRISLVTAPQWMATMDSLPAAMGLMGLRGPGREEGAEKAWTRSLSVLRMDAVKPIPEQNTCKCGFI